MENQEIKVVNDESSQSESSKGSSGNNFKKFGVLAIILLVAFLGLAALFLLKGNKTQPQENQIQAENTTNNIENKNSVGSGNVKEFTVQGSNFKFEPTEIKVNKGDTVRITFKDDDGTHNLVVDGYNVATRIISEGTDTVQFVADKTGSFEYYCSIGSHRQLGMKGVLTVE